MEVASHGAYSGWKNHKLRSPPHTHSLGRCAARARKDEWLKSCGGKKANNIISPWLAVMQRECFFLIYDQLSKAYNPAAVLFLSQRARHPPPPTAWIVFA
jgi:hypothetical protein